MAKTSHTGIDERGGRYRARVEHKGQILIKTFDSLSEAARWRKVMAGKLAGDTYEDRTEEKAATLHDLLEKYLLTVTPTKSGQKAERNRIRAWQRQEWAKWSVVEVKPQQITAWRDVRVAEGVAPTTVNNALNLLSRVFKVARAEWGLKIDNPCLGIARLKQREPREAPPDHRLEELLVERAKKSGAPWIAPLIIIAGWTAMRQGEIRKLRWEWIDFAKKLINLPAAVTKTKKGRGVVMLPVVEATLKEWLEGKARPKNGLVFPALRLTQDEPEREMSDSGISIAYRRIIAQVFDDEEIDTTGMERITFHDLRHWGCTRLAPLHRDAVDLSKTTGHKSLQQLARYYNERPEDRAARVLAQARNGG